VAWLPGFHWRLDQAWKALRSEVPWVKRRPSDYVLEHVRITTQPLEEPENPRHLLQLLELFPADRLLMFSSDYPHWDFDSPARAFPSLPPAMREAIFSTNARTLYGLP
jgi:predicted TIM-barrel fold metal-dependent hydrolase